MMRRVNAIKTIEMLPINWVTDLEWGDAFEGEFEGQKGVFLRIPSGLLLLPAQDGSGMRNWVSEGPPTRLHSVALLLRRVDINFEVL